MRNFIILLTLTTLFTFNSNAQNYFFVFLNSNPNKEKLSEDAVNELQKKHLDNISRLYNEGVIVAAGPFDGGGGLFIINEKDIESVKKQLATDPAIAANRFIIEIFTLEIEYGSICEVPETYEMGTYQFVRLRNTSTSNQDLDNGSDKEAFTDNIQNDESNLIFKGKFNDQNEGIIIFDHKDSKPIVDIISENPMVKKGSLAYEIKSLWIAKETFCKK